MRSVMAACVLRPALSEIRSGDVLSPAMDRAKPFLSARKVDCAGVIRLFNDVNQ